MSHSNTNDEAVRGPAAAWLAAGLALAGLGTVLLGPILPAISLRWHLSDQQVGPLFFAKFVGSFIGGVSVPRRLRNGILTGTLLAGAGFAAFGFAGNLIAGAATLFVAGIGLGQIIASTNVLAGHRYQQHTGSALSTLNFFFSLGAVLTGLLIAALEPRLGLSGLLFSIAAAFAAVGVAGRLHQASAASPADVSAAEPSSASAGERALTLFALLLFFYGGLETCLAGWLTTFTLRYSDDPLAGGQSAIVLLLGSLTAGRALSSLLLRYISERTMQRACLVFSFAFIVALATSSHAASLSLWSVMLGLALAPFFPATFALLMQQRPSARQAGFVLAVSGLGAAAFPWMMGIVSTRTGSLRTAMIVPAALTLLLLAVSFMRQPHMQPITAN